MVDPELLEKLCCPENHQPLSVADSAHIESLNSRIAASGLRDRSGRVVAEPLDGGLIRADGKYLYPIRKSIPILLIDESIPI